MWIVITHSGCRVEGAAGCQLKVMLLPEFSPTAGGSSPPAFPSQGAASSGVHAGDRIAADTGPDASPTQGAGAAAVGSTSAASASDGAAEGGHVGESCLRAQTYVLPLCWTCPVAVRGDGGREVHVRDPGRMLNLPANLKCFPHVEASSILSCCVAMIVKCCLHEGQNRPVLLHIPTFGWCCHNCTAA